MRTGLLTYAAIPVMLVLTPVLIGTVLFAPGLVGLLDFLGLGGLSRIASGVFTLLVAFMLVLAAWSARGTYHVREHVADMLPGAITFLGIVAVLRVLTA